MLPGIGLTTGTDMRPGRLPIHPVPPQSPEKEDAFRDQQPHQQADPHQRQHDHPADGNKILEVQKCRVNSGNHRFPGFCRRY